MIREKDHLRAVAERFGNVSVLMQLFDNELTDELASANSVTLLDIARSVKSADLGLLVYRADKTTPDIGIINSSTSDQAVEWKSLRPQSSEEAENYAFQPQIVVGGEPCDNNVWLRAASGNEISGYLFPLLRGDKIVKTTRAEKEAIVSTPEGRAVAEMHGSILKFVRVVNEDTIQLWGIGRNKWNNAVRVQLHNDYEPDIDDQVGGLCVVNDDSVEHIMLDRLVDYIGMARNNRQDVSAGTIVDSVESFTRRSYRIANIYGHTRLSEIVNSFETALLAEMGDDVVAHDLSEMVNQLSAGAGITGAETTVISLRDSIMIACDQALKLLFDVQRVADVERTSLMTRHHYQVDNVAMKTQDVALIEELRIALTEVEIMTTRHVSLDDANDWVPKGPFRDAWLQFCMDIGYVVRGMCSNKSPAEEVLGVVVRCGESKSILCFCDACDTLSDMRDRIFSLPDFIEHSHSPASSSTMSPCACSVVPGVVDVLVPIEEIEVKCSWRPLWRWATYEQWCKAVGQDATLNEWDIFRNMQPLPTVDNINDVAPS